ncbi:MAG: DNA methyltransferase [Bacillota bacterium]
MMSRGRKINQLNDLNGSQWLYWTDTMYITHHPPDATHALRKAHGAMKPPELMADIIRFFTKEGEMVLDPFAGVGGTLLGASLANRECLGFELNQRWVEVFQTIRERYVVRDGKFVERNPLADQPMADSRNIDGRLLAGDCLHLISQLAEESVDAVITDPPYGCQHGKKGFEAETNFNMFNTGEARDFANASCFPEYLEQMAVLGKEVWRVLKTGQYLILIIGDRYRDREYVPLGYQVAETMRGLGFKLKGIKLWCNKATQRPLRPYAVLTSFVPNITHQNIIIMRKEKKA